jgi:hypothetical protein
LRDRFCIASKLPKKDVADGNRIFNDFKDENIGRMCFAYKFV